MSSSSDQIPMDVSAIYLDNTSIQVSFTLPTGIVNPYYYYHVVAYDSSGNVYDTSGNTSPIVLYGLTESTTYTYYVETIQTSPSTSNISLRTAQWPRIYIFYATDISYNAAMLNWSGVDFSNVKITRGSTDISYISFAAGVTTGKYYDGYDLCGNTLYYYYITPYLTTGSAGTAVQTSIITKVAPVTNLIATPTSDGSAIILSFTASKNTYNTVYYTAKTTAADDFSGTNTTIVLQNLSGNTSYSSYVIVTLDNSSALVASSNTVKTTTAVQPPSGSVIFYDSSAIAVNLYSKNTYSSISYSASAGTSSTTGSSSTLLIQNLSGNTVYNISVSNTLNGNTYLFASSYINQSITTNVQPPTNVTLFYVDSSAIAVSYTPGVNSYNYITSTGYATDSLGRTNTGTSTTSPVYITDLSGNTKYTATVSTTLDGNTSLFSIASTSVSATTGVRPPYDILLSFYDSSSIVVSFSSAPNTYKSVSYLAYMFDQCGNSTSAQGTASPIQVKGLSADTTYTFYIKITLDGSANLTAQSNSINGTTSGYPVDKVIYLSAISYNTITVNWGGVDISYVMVYRNAQSLGTDYITPYIDSDISGNTYYSYYVVPYFIDRGNTITGEPSATVSTTTPISPISDLSMVFYDSSAITVTFTPGRNSYTSYIYYVASVNDTTVNPVSSASSPIQITGLSGNTSYNISITTVIDSSLNNLVSSSSVSATTSIQSPNNASVAFYDNSAISISLGVLPRNSYINTIYYIGTATDSLGYSISNTVDGSLYPSGIVITGLSGNTSYTITVATIVDNIYSNLINLGSIRTGIKMPYNLAANEIFTVIPSAASIIRFSFTEPPQSGNVYYIASIPGVDISSSSSPIIFTGLSGNTTYSISMKTMVDDNEYISPTNVSITTAIQTPVDVELLSLDDASFTVGFTVGRNTSSIIPAYYILRATDISSGSYTDSSSNDGVLYTYGYDAGETYSVDILTVVDNSMVSYGELFSIST